MQMPMLTNSYRDIISPKKRNAIIAANIGEVFYRNANLESEINLTAALNKKNVIVPEIALIITNFHYCGGKSTILTLSLAQSI